MTDNALQLLSDFRAEVAEPGEETASRIYALATAPATRDQRELERRWSARRPRLVLVVVAAALLAVPTAVAFGGKIVGLFQGTPAPAGISTNFAGSNRMADTMADFATRQGFALTVPHADVSKAHGVIEIETPDGPQHLWAAPGERLQKSARDRLRLRPFRDLVAVRVEGGHLPHLLALGERAEE
jgi:hypothetical protein